MQFVQHDKSGTKAEEMVVVVVEEEAMVVQKRSPSPSLQQEKWHSDLPKQLYSCGFH